MINETSHSKVLWQQAASSLIFGHGEVRSHVDVYLLLRIHIV